MALPSTVKGVIISIPDEGHHPISDEVTISLKNPVIFANKSRSSNWHVNNFCSW